MKVEFCLLPRNPLPSRRLETDSVAAMSEPIRERLSVSLKTSLKAKEKRAVSTLRLILAALKDRDIAVRGKGAEGIDDDEIMAMLQTMIKQRRESIKLYEKGERADLAKQEAEEIKIIEGFLPEQMSAEEMGKVIVQAITETGAENVKDMGRVMGELRERFAGQMDFAKAGAMVKEKLA